MRYARVFTLHTATVPIALRRTQVYKQAAKSSSAAICRSERGECLRHAAGALMRHYATFLRLAAIAAAQTPPDAIVDFEVQLAPGAPGNLRRPRV